MVIQKYLTNKHSSGFTLIELLISIAIISILASVGIQQFSQYKIRGYDAHSKQALRDMHMLCNVYWLDTDPEQKCDIPKIKDTHYGFNQNSKVVAILPPSPLDKFCGTAKHNSSPNTYSIDSAAMISDNENCGTGRAAAMTEKLEEEPEEEEEEEAMTCNNYCNFGNVKGRNRARWQDCYVYTGGGCSQLTSETCVPGKVSYCNHIAWQAEERARWIVKRLIAKAEKECARGITADCTKNTEEYWIKMGNEKGHGHGCLATNTC
jgi:prepilin-type N-terminal cleavage/methylation domain-containing protein